MHCIAANKTLFSVLLKLLLFTNVLFLKTYQATMFHFPPIIRTGTKLCIKWFRLYLTFPLHFYSGATDSREKRSILYENFCLNCQFSHNVALQCIWTCSVLNPFYIFLLWPSAFSVRWKSWQRLGTPPTVTCGHREPYFLMKSNYTGSNHDISLETGFHLRTTSDCLPKGNIIWMQEYD